MLQILKQFHINKNVYFVQIITLYILYIYIYYIFIYIVIYRGHASHIKYISSKKDST